MKVQPWKHTMPRAIWGNTGHNGRLRHLYGITIHLDRPYRFGAHDVAIRLVLEAR